MTIKPNRIDQAQFYKLCQWLNGLQKPITLTRRQLLTQASAFLGVEVSDSTVQNAVKTTGVVTKDPRAKNLKGSDRVVRLATAIEILMLSLSNEMGWKPDTGAMQILRDLRDRKNTQQS